ncbi:hypothetical protein CVU37_00335 [candidate division BRC1 bacterium HGW-BRC1-1]|jgi:hypothetical protein|nr:MAG: hypothetical protein CVU37_00335 [candidate division BRC1 bacterium HGW-BRC1-1]
MQIKRNFLTLALSVAAGVSMAQSVTVNSVGGADYTSISAALAAVQANAAGPDVITIQNAGPFAEAGQLLINGDATDNELTIQASAGVRPLVISSFNGDGAIYVNKNNKTTVKDLILIPGLVAAGVAPQSAIMCNEETGATNMEVVLQNILISSNNGANQPLASLDGLTPVTIDPLTMISFRDEGVYVQSSPDTMLYKITCEDVIVSGLFGDSGSDAFRTLQDGAAGSEFTVGPGCVASFNYSATATNAALQPGGNEGSVLVQIKGTSAKPVKFINNTLRGFYSTNTTVAGSTKNIEWAIITGNSGSGFEAGDSDENVTFSNVTIANNAKPLVATAAFASSYTMNNVIVAGNGTEGVDNTINVSTSAAGTLTANNSAFVLAGAYKLDTTNFDLDGLDDNTPTSNVTKTAVIGADPDFASLDPANANFGVVKNVAYATAGPGGTPLTGGGTYNPTAAVADWSIY